MRKIINGVIYLNDLHLTELFDLSDVEVKGDFWCCSNNLTNLEGAPQTVRGSFYCYENNLTSLKGIPKIIGDTKWEKIYDDVDETIIWRYDLSKNMTGPYEVEIRQKKVNNGILP